MNMQISQRSDYTFKYNNKLGRHGWLRLTPAYSVKLVTEIIGNIPKDSVKDAAESAIELTDAWQYVREQEFIKKAKEDGFTITYPDTAPFKKASEKVYSKWFKKNPHWKIWYKDIQMLDPDVALPEAYGGKRD